MLSQKLRSFVVIVLFAALIFSVVTAEAQQKQPPRPKLKLAVSIYAGWMPWYYAADSGILKKWGDAQGVDIEVVRMDYIASLEAYVAKKVDAVVATNMETLDLPAASGIDSTSIITGDFSNGNDAVLSRKGNNVCDLKGEEISLVEGSVSHYLLVRALEKNGCKESDISILNTSDADIAPAFISNRSQQAVVTWNPMVMQIREQVIGVKSLFTSADIPGEVLDLLVVRTDALTKYPEFGRALTGAWYEVMGIMTQRGTPERKTAIEQMAKASGADVTAYEAQLKTTAMFYTPKSAVDYTAGAEIKNNMNTVRQFCFAHKLLGENTRSVDDIGIQYPDGSVQGSKANIKFRFDNSFMQLAALGKLKR